MSEPDLLSTTIGWPDSALGPWVVTIEWVEMNGRFDVGSFEIKRIDLSEPVTGTVLRSIPLGRLAEEGRREKAEWFEAAVAELTSAARPLSRDVLDAIEGLRPLLVTSGRRGRPAFSPEHYQQVADVYAMAWASGQPPTKAVAEKWDVSSEVAAKWVAVARHKFKFLEPTEKGRAGGVRTERPKKERKPR